MVARVNKRGKLSRYVSTWTRSWRVVSATVCDGGAVGGLRNPQNLEDLRTEALWAIAISADNDTAWVVQVKSAGLDE